MSGLFENFPYTNFHEVNLGWVIKTVKELADQYGGVGEMLDEISAAVSGNTAAIASLNTRFQRLENGEYIENYIPALADWINNNLIELVSRIAKFVVFGLTDNGYFYADIPESWEQVQFSTGYDPEIAMEYLHLIINY